MEDVLQPFPSCTKQKNVSSRDMYDTLLDLFNGGQPYVEPIDAQVIKTNNQSLQVLDQPTDEHVDDVDLYDAVDEHRIDIEESINMPKGLVQTLCDNKLASPLSICTRLGSHHASYTYESYVFVASNMCDEEEPVSFDEA